MITCRNRLSRENQVYKIRFQASYVRQSQKNHQMGIQPLSAQVQLGNKTLKRRQTMNCHHGSQTNDTWTWIFALASRFLVGTEQLTAYRNLSSSVNGGGRQNCAGCWLCAWTPASQLVALPCVWGTCLAKLDSKAWTLGGRAKAWFQETIFLGF